MGELSVQIESLEKELEVADVDIHHLVYLEVGSQKIVGETDSASIDTLETDRSMVLYHPKNIVTTYRQMGGGMAIEIFAMDYGFIEKGPVLVESPSVICFYASMDDGSKLNLLKILKEYYYNKMQERAMKAGLTLSTTMPPNIKPHG